MKSFIKIFIIGFCLFLSGCSGTTEINEVMKPNTSSQNSSISVCADIDESTESTIVNTKKSNGIFAQNIIEKAAIEFIKNQKIAWGCFYDFDKDGVPEIAEQRGGETEGQIDYTIYKLYREEYIEIGTIYVCEDNNTDAFLLYYDNNSCNYFYVGSNILCDKNSGEKSMYRYVFEDGEITTTEIAYYHYTYTEEDLIENRVFIDKSRFDGNTLDLNGYCLINEVNDVIGIVDYLSQYEKIEKVDLVPQYGWYDEDLEEKVRDKLNKYLD